MQGLYDLYSELQGARIARKHVGWYLKDHPDHQDFRRHFNTLLDAEAQYEALDNYFKTLD